MEEYDSIYVKYDTSRKKKKIASIFAFICLICVALYNILGRANILVNEPDRLLIIPRGYTLQQVKDTLKKEGYIKNVTFFVWTAYLLRYNPQLTPGQYRLRNNMSNWQAIKMLRGAIQAPVKFTFSTAENKESLVEQFTRRIGVEKETLLALLNDATMLSTHGFTPENVLTMFIPDTYEFYWTITAEKFFLKMYSVYQRFWNTTRLVQAARMKLSPIEVSILASIVQSETNHQQDAAMIAGVYVNRLKRHMCIESDPVILYALKDKEKSSEVRKRVLWKDTYLNSPYNSYRRKGLPPGPITLPSVAMIDAVLNYVKHAYLFFSAKNDFSGLHYFTKNYQEHVKNANKYRKALNAKKIML